MIKLGNDNIVNIHGVGKVMLGNTVIWQRTPSTVSPPITVTSRINQSTDDIEATPQGGQNGYSVTSGDLELGYNGVNFPLNVIGLRFNGLNIPQGATINSAFVQFTGERTSAAGSPSLQIFGADVDNMITYVDTAYVAPPKTTASVNWNSIPVWTLNQSGSNERTPDIKDIIQEIVNRAGFTSSSSIGVIIEAVTGTGTNVRRGKSWDNSTTDAPQISVTYTTTTTNE